ncbi:Cell division transporter, ATP-binding protein FtsE [Methanosarcina barkeri 3]|uniref:Cell division transporter, ATP-binding protein FtsE n=1 Tax=Methanosarcina barkeri 3 TaxID=1434107 RepID=A0A0E3SK86_METBA|nr:Cell division transporter, ATP-binding protein FtsE [Methanosarcina barkeri 3]
MALTGIIDSLKTALNSSKMMNFLEGAASFSDPSEEDSEGNLKINPYLNSGNGVADSSNAVMISQNKDEPLIKLTDVWKIYQMGEVEFAALKGINLEIYEGEFLIILGPSGSGKSTMMNLLGCLDIPSKGTVSLNSKDISELDESELAIIRGKMIGFIFQSFNLLPTLSTEENVLLPMEFQEENRQIARQKASYLLDIVGLSNKKGNLPSQLSGGQRQRVAIARSLAVNPPIILADEPTGNLDTKTGDYILEFLDGLQKSEGKTIIIVTHDIELVRYATRVVYIRDGEIEKIEKRQKNSQGSKSEANTENELNTENEPNKEDKTSAENQFNAEKEPNTENTLSSENQSNAENKPNTDNELNIENEPNVENKISAEDEPIIKTNQL